MADLNQIELPNGTTYNLSSYKLLSSDTRSDNQLPSWYMSNYPKCTVEEFKSCSSIGVNSIMSGTFCVLNTITPWTDSSGGRPVQIAVSDSGVRAQRVATANNTWGSWVKLPNSDTNTTYTFANGTNGFTVTPSGGSAQTVTVTPSIANNVTGSGTSGYLTKFDGAHTITNGPSLGSDTTKFLRNDGTWQTPSVRQVYFDTPTVPYSVGDLWLGNGNIWYCTVARTSSEEYDESDWDASVDYAEYTTALLDTTISCLTGNEGGKVILRLDGDGKPYEMSFTDTNGKIWKFDGTGFKFSSDNGGSYVPITNSNGQFDATFITSGVLDASKVTITNFSTSDITTGDLLRGGADNSLGTVIVKNQQNVVIGEINKLGLKIYGPGDAGARPYIILNDSEFFAGYNANGTMIFKVVGNVVNMVNASVTNNLTVGNKDGYKISFVPITITDTDGNIVNDGVAIV